MIDPQTLDRRDRLAAQRARAGEPPLPSLGRQLAGAVRTAGRVAVGAARGAVFACETTVADRLRVCHACPSQQYRPSDGRCGACGCVVAVKARFAAASCPRHHWPALASPTETP